jgi:hypothetical protein
MSNYFSLLETIYSKRKLETTEDQGLCIALSKTLAKDQDNLNILREVVQYLFYINPKHYFYLLYFTIGKKNRVPTLIKTEKKDKTDNKIYDRIQHIFQWSNKERLSNTVLLDKIITDKKFWNDELGVKNEKY